MLDTKDKTNLKNLTVAAARVNGFYCVLGPTALFPHAVTELKEQFQMKHGMLDGKEIHMDKSFPDEIDALADNPPPVLYCYCSVNPHVFTVWNKIQIRRTDFIAKSIIIFFFTPSQYTHFKEQSAAVASLIGIEYPIGAQRTLDAMGDEFQKRLYDVLDRIDTYEEKLNHLIKSPSPEITSDFLLVLRRWNSFSPILGWRPIHLEHEAEEAVWKKIRREIRGGGYLLRWNNFGVAIDPGHNFIENLYQTKHSINEIDAIVITHDHLDHTADFEAIIDLLYQCNKRGNPKTISVYLNPTMYRKYSHILKNNPFIGSQRVKKLRLDEKKAFVVSQDIHLFSIWANHIELNDSKEAVSLRFQLKTGINEKSISVGFTADTGWHEPLAPFFRQVDLLVTHVGSIKRYEIDEAKFYGTHLGILGLFKTLHEISEAGGTPTVIISEFGEELSGLRDILGEELGRRFPAMNIFPADIGHMVELKQGNLRIPCGENCTKTAKTFFEHNGEIQLRCLDHKPTLGTIGERINEH